MDLSKLFPGVSPTATSLQSLYTPYNPTVIPGLNMMSFSGDPNVGGFVRRDNPSTIWLNQKADFKKDFPQTIPHEMEHVLQNRVNARSPDFSYTNQVLDELGKVSNDPSSRARLVNALMSSALNKEIPSYFQQKYNYPIAYYGQLDKGEYDLREQWAELSAAEQYLKKDLTKDPFVRKNIFNDDDALIRTYKGTTGLRTDRWDARDLPPMTADPAQQQNQSTPQPSFLESLFSKFK